MLNRFHALYEKIMASFPLTEEDPLVQEWYGVGMQLLNQHLADFSLSHDILYKLLFIFPRRAELYYYMGCVYLRHQPENFVSACYWFQAAFREFAYSPTTPLSNLHPCHIENLLDFFKILFDRNFTAYAQYLMDTNADIFKQYLDQERVDARWLLFLGAFYIKTNRLHQAETIYTRLLTSQTDNKELQYQIYNNCLIMYTRMANFDQINDLVRRNFSLCHSMLQETTVDMKTKCNVFCSNMLIYDYMYHSMEERRELCQHVDTYFPRLEVGGVPSPTKIAPRAKITVGYLSSDFIQHAVSHFILPILEHHNTDVFQVIVLVSQNYATWKDDPKYRPWWDGRCRAVNIQGLSTQECAQLIRELQIDILIDLNGFTEHHRLDVMAQRAAPIQIGYLGFPNSVGSRNLVQYRITDHVADPPTSAQWYAETRLYLPRCFLLYKPLAQTEPFPAMRMSSLLFPWIVLGAMNRESKNSDEVLVAWRQILEQTSHTKLLIKLSTVEDDAIHIDKYRQKLGLIGPSSTVNPDRVVFAKYGSTEEYYLWLSHINIFLDTFPYSGTTTSCNALYNSIPVVTRSHPHLHAHNVTASILTGMGCPELIGGDVAEYVKIAVGLSKDTARQAEYRGVGVQEYRGTIHQRFQRLMNPGAFMPKYEALLAQLYLSHVNGTAA
jgi:predicted O-linked N-acetylglucosamine transferase (SPINDLY family)